MEFSCSREALSNVMALMTDVIPSRSVKPVLQNVQITGNEDGTVTFAGTDLEIGLRVNVEVDSLRDPESVLLPAHKLFAWVRGDWAPTVHLAINDNRAELKTENGTFHLVGAAGEEFPVIQGMPEGDVLRIPAEDFCEAIKLTMFATAKGDSRYALNGVFLNIDKKNVEFVASDTHRLSLVQKKSRSAGKPGDAIVVTKGMSSLARLAEGEEEVKLHLTSKEMIAQTSRGTVVARLVDGQFPRYREVIPKDLGIKIKANRDLLIKTVSLCGQLADEETRSVTLRSDGDILHVEVKGSEHGDGSMEVPIELEGDGVETSFNFNYLLEALKAVQEETIDLQFRDGESPMRIDSGDFTHIIMPIRAHG